MKNKRLIPDRDLPKIIGKVRKILGSDVLVIFKVKDKGSTFHAFFDDEPEEPDDDTGDYNDFDFENIERPEIKRIIKRNLKREYPNKKEKLDYFG